MHEIEQNEYVTSLRKTSAGEDACQRCWRDLRVYFLRQKVILPAHVRASDAFPGQWLCSPCGADDVAGFPTPASSENDDFRGTMARIRAAVEPADPAFDPSGEEDRRSDEIGIVAVGPRA
jgi:hypothetical protein